MTASRRRPAVLTAGVVGTAALALSMSGTLSAFSAAITNSADTAGSGTLTMQETNADGTVICNSNAASSLTDANNTNATCSTINKYGGNLTMAASSTAGTANTTSVSTPIHIKNTGTLIANQFTLTAGTCTQTANADANGTTGSATDFCKHLNVTITSGGKTVYSGTADALASQTFDLVTALGSTVAAGATVDLTVTTQVDPAAGNSYQGLKISQPLTWTFNA